MHLHRLLLFDFKNIREADLTFSPNINCFSGNNGAGKTNVLDAVYYLSMAKSYFGQVDTQAVRFGAEVFSVSGFYHFEEAPQEHITCSVTAAGDKILKRNGKAYTRFSEHLGLLPLVMVSPADTQLVHAAAEERRKFANALLAQIDTAYLSVLHGYSQLLFQRNTYLKRGNITGALLETFDEQLSVKAALIYDKRKDLCERLAPEVTRFYKLLSGDKEEVGLHYSSDLDRGSLLDLLKESAQRDQALQYTSKGIHRDDLAFTLDGRLLKKFGSQGQQKTFLLALKLAQFEIMKQRCGMAPILLLDDVFDKLDMNRVSYLLALVAQEHFGQIFISDSNKSRIEGVVHDITDEHAFYEVESGKIIQR